MPNDARPFLCYTNHATTGFGPLSPKRARVWTCIGRDDILRVGAWHLLTVRFDHGRQPAISPRLVLKHVAVRGFDYTESKPSQPVTACCHRPCTRTASHSKTRQGLKLGSNVSSEHQRYTSVRGRIKTTCILPHRHPAQEYHPLPAHKDWSDLSKRPFDSSQQTNDGTRSFDTRRCTHLERSSQTFNDRYVVHLRGRSRPCLRWLNHRTVLRQKKRVRHQASSKTSKTASVCSPSFDCC